MIHSVSAIFNTDPPDEVSREDAPSPTDAHLIFDIFKDFSVSCHYLIARDGEIFQLISDSRKAWHAGKGSLPFGSPYENALNNNSIGIELVSIGSVEDLKIYFDESESQEAYAEWYQRIAKKHSQDVGFTEQQYTSLRALLLKLCDSFPGLQYDREHIFAHSEYAPKRRTDPGSLFSWQTIKLPEFPKI